VKVGQTAVDSTDQGGLGEIESSHEPTVDTWALGVTKQRVSYWDASQSALTWCWFAHIGIQNCTLVKTILSFLFYKGQVFWEMRVCKNVQLCNPSEGKKSFMFCILIGLILSSLHLLNAKDLLSWHTSAREGARDN